ncbi:MAG: mevalonate kinase [Anaerolineales bacterium]|jgi:mevalonate kinase
MTQASAPGKIILFGEHAVVYGRPAIAVPLPSIRATVEVDALPPKDRSGILIQSPALDLSFLLSEVGSENPLGLAVHLTLQTLQVTYPANMRITIRSDIPLSAGLGSGAAVTVAMVRAICRHFSRSLGDEQISKIAYEVEKLHHGTPSGVDNTVISYEMPVYFQRGKPVERFSIHKPISIVMGHSGESSSTAQVVGQVRKSWESNRSGYESTFDSIGRITDLAYAALKRGDLELLGPLMDQNQMHLEALGVSNKKLDHLIVSAKKAGAAGAKLSGAGQGGFMIALVEPAKAQAVMDALESAGSTQVFRARIA